MKRFLVVGCGGSGGVTLQFLMDQLRADLARVGIDQLPRAWQFVHIDVPLNADGTGPGRPPLVKPPNGRYVPMTYRGATYGTVYNNVAGTLRQSPGGVDHLASWVPREDCSVPVVTGAGQYRAVGRTLTLPKVLDIEKAISAARDELVSVAAGQELRRVAEAFSGGTADEVDDVPVTLVVSSMAGGAGASMVLDVCRIIAGVHANLAGNSALFVYTPEIFRSLDESQRQGIDANAMAMTGELLGAQLGASAADDLGTLASLGWSPAARDAVPFRRVFPIGAKVGGDGSAFGNGTTDGIYRATGRGLAALMLSESASRDFVSFDLTNSTGLQTNVDVIGWGGAADRIQWGSFGFASVGLGRERYAEYAAQRIARVAVDRLATGHLAVGDHSTGSEQLAKRIDHRWPVFREQVGLPTGSTEDELWRWVAAVAPDVEVVPSMRSAFDQVLSPGLRFSGALSVGQFTESWRQQAVNSRPRLVALVEAEAYRAVHAWHERFRASVERAAVFEAATSGLPTVGELLQRARAEAPHLATLLRDRALREPLVTTPDRPDERSWQALQAQAQTKAQLQPGHPLLLDLQSGHVLNLVTAVRARTAQLLAEVLTSARDDLLGPLATAANDVLAELETARTAGAVDTGLAQVQTDLYAAWPVATGEVPKRFASAENEVFLTPSATFEGIFQAHLAADPGQAVQDSLSLAVTQVLQGVWPASGGAHTELVVVEPRATWRPGALPRTPNDPTGTPQPPQRAHYGLRLAAADVLERTRGWLGRPQQPFSRFVGQSLHGYVTEPGVSTDELDRRVRDVRDGFGRALALSRPLVAVNPSSYQKVHSRALTEHFKFSEVPFRGLPLASQLEEDLRTNPQVDQLSAARIAGAVTDGHSNPTTRIDIFGSYAPALPLVFTSLLGPIAERWAGALQPGARTSFWTWRRARRLPGALPLTTAARQAMIGGFFVGRLTGQVRLPGEGYGTAVEIYEAQGPSPQWHAFPDPLLTPPEQHRSRQDLLPALLESILIAVARCHSSPDLAPLHPYLLLRRLYDASATDRLADYQRATGLAAAQHLSSWLSTGQSVSGEVPAASRSGEAGPAGTFASRKEAVQAYLSASRDTTARDWVPPGTGGGTAPSVRQGTWSDLTRVEPWTVPIYHEIAPDVLVVLDELLEVVDRLTETTTARPGGDADFDL